MHARSSMILIVSLHSLWLRCWFHKHSWLLSHLVWVPSLLSLFQKIYTIRWLNFTHIQILRYHGWPQSSKPSWGVTNNVDITRKYTDILVWVPSPLSSNSLLRRYRWLNFIQIYVFHNYSQLQSWITPNMYGVSPTVWRSSQSTWKGLQVLSQ